MANLNEDHYSSLNNWVNEGGTLIIGTGANESKTITNINKNFLNISSEGTIERNVAITNENLNLILSHTSELLLIKGDPFYTYLCNRRQQVLQKTKKQV